jgi:hypothetical protein
MELVMQDSRQDEQDDFGAVYQYATRPRRARVATRRLNPVADSGLGKDVRQDEGKYNKPDYRSPHSETANGEISDDKFCQQRFGFPGRLRETIGNVQRCPAHNQQHTQRDQKRWNFEAGDKPAIGKTDDRRDQNGDKEPYFE